jgi:hypothetical protein
LLVQAGVSIVPRKKCRGHSNKRVGTQVCKHAISAIVTNRNRPLKFCRYVKNKWRTQGQATVKHGYTFHSRRPNSTLTSLRPVHVSSRTLAMHASDEEATCSRISRSIVNCARARVVVNPLVHCHDIVRVVSVSIYPLLHAASLRRTSVVVPVVRNRK